MYPKITTDQPQCLQQLVALRSFCNGSVPNAPFYIEDIEGIDQRSLAQAAKDCSLSGRQFAIDKINAAAREMLGDIELMMNNGYRLNETIGNICSTCQLLPIYTVNSGVVVKNAMNSKYQTLSISQLSILINQSGEKEFQFDDGITQTKYKATFQAGVIQPVRVNYTTAQPQVKIFFTDNTIGLGQIQCAVQSSCGCGGSQQVSPVTIAGILAGNEVATQYGFLPCAIVGCSYETMICQLIAATPRLFGLTLLYKVAEKLYLEKQFSQRNNEVVSFNAEQPGPQQKNYSILYWARMTGTKDGRSKGIKHVLNDYLAQNRGDKCVNCDGKIYISNAVG